MQSYYDKYVVIIEPTSRQKVCGWKKIYTSAVRSVRHDITNWKHYRKL